MRSAVRLHQRVCGKSGIRTRSEHMCVSSEVGSTILKQRIPDHCL
jgi:hypothetical protein